MSEIKLILGRCLTLMPDILDQSVDLVLADPPYKVTACFWDQLITLEPMWEQLKRIGKPNTAFVFTASQPFTTDLISSNRKMFKYCWVWVKTKASNFQLAHKMPMKRHEDIAVFYRKLPTYNHGAKQLTKCLKTGRINQGGNLGHCQGSGKEYMQKYGPYPTSDIYFRNPSGVGHLHPTQKPVKLMEYMIKTYSNEGDTVLDFCMGSGTTGVACKNLKRNFIGIESDKFYFGIAKRRIEETPDV